MKVLVVDDIPENVDLLEALLQGQGYEVSTAVNGAEALERLKQDHAALIISDILMPKMDGFQLCRAVKADDALKNIPFIFYTATYTTKKDKDFALNLGASRFILKSTATKEFIGMVQEVLAEKGAGLIKPGVLTIEKETEYLKEHQARLIKKLGDKITELVADGRHNIIIDMEAVEFLDSTGLGVLVGGLKKVRAHDGSLELVCTQDRLLKIFRITGLAKVFAIHGTPESALATF